MILRMGGAALIAAIARRRASPRDGLDVFTASARRPRRRAAVPTFPVRRRPEEDQTAALVLRVNRLEDQLRRPTASIEELENAQRRLQDQLQKFRQDVEFRLGDRSAPPAPASAPPPVAWPRRRRSLRRW